LKTRALAVLVIALAVSGMSSARAQASWVSSGKLAFAASETNEFAFDTGVLKGKLRAGGKSTGLSSVVHLPTGTRLDHSMGLFGHYRVFSANRRYGNAAWDWPSEAKLRPDGSVETYWPSAQDHPFELRAVYRWTAPDTLDLETSVLARTNLTRFESFLASYFSESFTNACVLARLDGSEGLVTADRDSGVWQAFPRDDEAVSIIKDGRWKFPPSPVDWIIRPRLAKPIGLRRCLANNLQVVVMSPPQDCFAVLTPFDGEGHRSLYPSLFGKDLRAGQTVRARARLVVGTNPASDAIGPLYAAYLRQIQ
jgi:hypothetical protein